MVILIFQLHFPVAIFNNYRNKLSPMQKARFLKATTEMH